MATGKAVDKCRQGRMTILGASKHFYVPRKTISDHVNNRIEEGSNPGPNRELTDDEERALVEYISHQQSANFPLQRSDIRATIQVNMKNHFIYNFKVTSNIF